MIWCTTYRSGLSYNGYGCYCGYGGSGTPVDGVDRCCETHDRCYSDLYDEGYCPRNVEIFTALYKFRSQDCLYSWSRLFGGSRSPDIQCSEYWKKGTLRRMDLKTLVSVILLMPICLSWAHELGPSHGGSPFLSRPRRNLLEFSAMISCATTRSSLDYISYGCHCGYGGSGISVDVLDSCCEAHDNCYERIKNNFDGQCNVYYSSYKYSLRDCLTTGNSDPQIECNGTLNTQCLQELCDCDRTAAFCFAAASYNAEYRNYDKATHCQDPNLTPNPTPRTSPSPSPSPSPSSSPTHKMSAGPQYYLHFIQMGCMICIVLAYVMS
eukprot:XP_011682361.1 PREDICTED: uncharacterized protein LOC752643 isoform X2 [Strongylocentrotus purpuratus]